MRRSTFDGALSLLWVFALMGPLVWAPAAVAQEGQDQPTDEAKEEAQGEVQDEEALEEASRGVPERAAAARGRRSQDDLQKVMGLRKQMIKELELGDEQLEAISALFEDHLEAIRERARQVQSRGGEDAARARELQKRLAEARRQRDREAMKAVFQEMRELRGPEWGSGGVHAEFREAILKELDEDQAVKFKALFRKIMMPRSTMTGSVRDIRAIRQALRSLDLSPEQQQATYKHLSGLREALSASGEGGREARAQAVAEARQAILGELDSEQVERFEAAEVEARRELERDPGARRRRPRSQRQGATEQ